MEKDLVSLINKIQSKRGEDAFEVSNNPISQALNLDGDLKVVYDEGDLTKNFVKFATDLLSNKYGDYFMEDIIKGFGETLKTDKKDFKESYRNKPSSIKEILPSVFIHTSMSKILMESLIIDLIRKARLTVKFYSFEKGRDQTWTMELIMKEAEKYDSITSFSKGNINAYSAAVKLGIKEAIVFAMKKKKHGMGNEQPHRETPERLRREKMKNV
jgi:hypothetical protein